MAANNTREIILDGMLNGEVPEIRVETTKERLLLAMAGALDGEPVPEIETQTTEEQLMLAVAQKLAEGGGGGNPNTVQTITGTVGNPWGDVDYDELMTAIKSGDASAMLDFTFNQIPVSLRLSATEEIYGTTAQILPVSNIYLAASATWHGSNPIEVYMVGTDTSNEIIDASATVKDIPSTLTIIWHPLPEGDGDA